MIATVNATYYLGIIAGGDANKVGIGGAAENQGIGRQWPKGDRAAGLAREARFMRRNGMAGQRMSLKLERCKK